MKQAEKLDALLLQLYHHKYDGRWYSISQLIADKGITVTNDVELLVTATRLVSDGLINARATDDDITAMITGDGISFCETSSFSNPGVSLSNQSFERINEKISDISQYLYLTDIEDPLRKSLLQGLSEVAALARTGKDPLFCLGQLAALTLPYRQLHEQMSELRQLVVGK